MISSACCWRPTSSARGRLVEQQQRRLLREGAGEHGPLPLAAGERAEPPAGELQQIEPPERVARRVAVARLSAREVADVRRAAEQHVSRDGHLRGHRRRCGTSATRRARSGAPSARRRARRARSTRVRDSRRWPAERRLAGAVRPDQRQPLPGATVERRRPWRTAVAPSGPDAVERERGSRRARRARSTMKNGAPKNAVTTPIGVSAGVWTVRARVGEDQKARAEHHRQRQQHPVAPPASSRIVCGTMIPTKPIRPLTATAAAVPSVAATTTMIRTRAVHAEAGGFLVADREDVEQAAVAAASRRDDEVRQHDAHRATAVASCRGSTSRPPGLSHVLLLHERLQRRRQRAR